MAASSPSTSPMQKSQRVSSTPRSRREPSTVVAWITDSEGNVLVLRKRDDAFFSEPGGKVEPGETLEQTVIREVLQETGLNLPAISTDNGHKTVQQWVVFQASLTGERPTVVSQSEYSDGEAVWIKPEDIVITTPPGGSCACSGCDAMTAKTKLFYFQRPNSHVWICPTCKPEYEGRAGYTLKIRAGYRLTKTMQATMVTDARPGMGIRAAGEVISFNTPTRKYVPTGTKLFDQLKKTSAVLMDADCGLGKSTCIRQFLEELHTERQGDVRILLISVRIIHAYDIAAAVTSDRIQPVTYLDEGAEGANLFQNACVVVSMEQLHRAFAVEEPWTVVVLDEVRSGLGKFMFESTLKDMNSAIQFDRVCRECEYLVAADADCRKDSATEVFLKGLRRPYVVWDIPVKRLKRRLSVEFNGDTRAQTTIPQIFKNELESLQDGEKLGVVCATATAAKAYAQYCADRGKSHELYHGSVSETKKRDHFRDPDAAWADVQVVIYNLCVTVGVDPKTTTFKCMLLHTSYAGGDWFAVFQAIKRFNRHLSNEFVIHTVLTCKRPEEEALESYTNAQYAADREASRPTLPRILDQVNQQVSCLNQTARHCMDEAGQSGGVSVQAPSYFNEVRAHVQLTAMKHRSKHTHFAEFMRMAEKSGWPVEFKGDVAATELRDVLARTLNEEEIQEIRGTLGLVQCLHEQLEPLDPDDKLQLVEEFRAASEQLVADKRCSQRDAFDASAVELYFLLYNLRGADVLSVFQEPIEDSFKALKANFGKITRYANAVFRSERDIYLCAALKYHQGHHPNMKCKEINFANSYDAWNIFTGVMECSRETQTISVPGAVLEAINCERRQEALLGLNQHIKQRLTAAVGHIGLTEGGIWKCIQAIAKQFGFKHTVKTHNRTINGTYYQKQFQSVELTLELSYLDNWSLYNPRVSPGRFINVHMWEAHEAEMDLQTIEDNYHNDMDLISSVTQNLPTPVGVYEELVHRDTLVELVNADRPYFHDDDEGRKLGKKWDRDHTRLCAMQLQGCDKDGGSMVIRVSCYRKYGTGRRIMASPSLQGCPKVHRGPLAVRYCHDLDIENAHYSIMRQIAVEHGVTLTCVEHYCHNTQQCRQLIRNFYDCSKKAAKQLFLSLLNGGDVPKWMYDFKISRRLQADLREGRSEHPGIVQQLRIEYDTIQHIMFEKYQGQVDLLMDQIKRDYPQKRRRFDASTRRMLEAEDDRTFEMRVRRSTFSTLLQNEEDQALQAIEDQVRELGYIVRCPIFDGCLIERKGEEPLSGDFIRACEGATRVKTGYNLKLWEKCLLCGEKLHECACVGLQTAV